MKKDVSEIHEAFRRGVRAGFVAMKSGEFTEYTATNIKTLSARVQARGRKRLAALDLASLADARVGIRQGLEDARAAKTRPVRDFFAEFEAKNDIQR